MLCFYLSDSCRGVIVVVGSLDVNYMVVLIQYLADWYLLVSSNRGVSPCRLYSVTIEFFLFVTWITHSLIDCMCSFLDKMTFESHFS